MSSATLAVIKGVSALISSFLVMSSGSIPLYWEKFRSSQRLLSLANAFAGGLFLAVSLVHLLPEANEAFEEYYIENNVTDSRYQLPWNNVICGLCFALLLFIEKVIFKAQFYDNFQDSKDARFDENQILEVHEQAVPLDIEELKNIRNQEKYSMKNSSANENEIDEADESQELTEKKHIQYTLVKKMNKPKKDEETVFANRFSPYLLQVAMSINAIFEGMAIGIAQSISSCIGVMLAVLGHKWAEGLTLGVAFAGAKIEKNTAIMMLALQSIMNPIGVIIGWTLCNRGVLVRGIFESVSAGTFLYVAVAEIIVNEFNLARYRLQKFLLFVMAFIFISGLSFIEQENEEILVTTETLA